MISYSVQTPVTIRWCRARGRRNFSGDGDDEVDAGDGDDVVGGSAMEMIFPSGSGFDLPIYQRNAPIVVDLERAFADGYVWSRSAFRY